MREKLDAILQRTRESLEQADRAEAVENLRVWALGKKGELTGLLRGMGQLPAEERPKMGAMVNEVREQITQLLDERKRTLAAKEQQLRLAAEAVDVTLPGKTMEFGRIHPLRQVQRDLEAVFTGMGFTVEDGPEVELDYYNFEMMNIPKNHPARDMQDSIYINPQILLRTHTSPTQSRAMQRDPLPIRIVVPGRVYRYDEVDATHSPIFHQMEGLVVDKGINMGHLKGTLDAFARAMFGPETRTRLRPSYFPFTEPSAEVDLSCAMCGGKGCNICKGTGWIEVLGSGMVNPRVLQLNGIDPNEYSGFAFGLGLDRIAMIKYGISDIRLFLENDARFLEQF
ncbi:MAG: phenylalanine--tRNA ligase subunit alpha [Christensenellales bacterium]